jgi:putative addiction module killer protein
MDIREFLDDVGRSPFGEWFNNLDAVAAARITVALTRLALGNTSNTKGVGAGVFELKLAFGPGFRVYFGKDGSEIVILLGGGTKKRQNRDYPVGERPLAYVQGPQEGRTLKCL